MATAFAAPANNAGSLLAADYTAGSGTMTLAPGAVAAIVAKTGALSASRWLRFTVVSAGAIDDLGNPTDESQLTIFKATGSSGNDLTGLVAIESTIDQNFFIGDFANVWLTDGTIDDIQAAITTIEVATTGMSYASGVTTLVNSLAVGTSGAFQVEAAGHLNLTATSTRITLGANAVKFAHDGSNGTIQNNTGSFSFLNTSVSGNIALATNGINRVLVDANGRVLVNETSPGAAGGQLESQAKDASTPIFAGYTYLGGSAVVTIGPAGEATFNAASTFNGGITSPGAAAGTERFGLGATTSANYATAVGYNATAAAFATAIGSNGATAASLGIAIGYATSAHSGAIVIGAGVSSTAANQLVIGSWTNGVPITDVYIGGGVASSNASHITYHASDRNGTDIAGNDFTIAAGRGTGTGAGGSFKVRVAPAGGSTGSTANALADAFVVDSTKTATFSGPVTAPAYRLTRKAVTGATTLVAADNSFVAITTIAAPYTITLPAANSVPAGHPYVFKDESGTAGANTVTIAPAGADTGEAAFTLAANYAGLKIYSDGVSKWFLHP